MLAWLAPLLVLGLVVFVHELGHFLAAKITGVYAPRFSLGWGKPIWRWRPQGSETEYVISVLPIGGYVRMASRDDETMAKIEGGTETAPTEEEQKGPHWDPDAMVPHGPHPVPADRWFESKPVLARVFILLAGVTMNAILTIVVATGIFAGYGRQVPPAVVDSVVAGGPAARAGFQKGDSIVSVDTTRIRNWGGFIGAVSARPGQAIQVGVIRADARLTLDVSVEARAEADPTTGAPITVGRIGLGRVNRSANERIGLVEAAGLGWNATWEMAGKVTGVLGGLFRGTVSVKTLGGPIAIARASVSEARAGLVPLFSLIAFLSINLAVLNLLPVPILDGGQIIMTIAEGVRGKPLSLQFRENSMKVGVALILLLFAIVMFNDIKALVVSWML